MSNDEVKKILSMSPKKQEAWLKKQEWYDEETFFTDIDREFMGAIYGDLDEQVRYELDNLNIDEYSSTFSLVTAGHISEKRYKEIIKGNKPTEEEIGFLKESIRDESLDDGNAPSIMKKEIEVNKAKLFVFYTAHGHPNLGPEQTYEFEGIFKDDEDAMKFFSKYGEVDFFPI